MDADLSYRDFEWAGKILGGFSLTLPAVTETLNFDSLYHRDLENCVVRNPCTNCGAGFELFGADLSRFSRWLIG